MPWSENLLLTFRRSYCWLLQKDFDWWNHSLSRTKKTTPNFNKFAPNTLKKFIFDTLYTKTKLHYDKQDNKGTSTLTQRIYGLQDGLIITPCKPNEPWTWLRRCLYSFHTTSSSHSCLSRTRHHLIKKLFEQSVKRERTTVSHSEFLHRHVMFTVQLGVLLRERARVDELYAVRRQQRLVLWYLVRRRQRVDVRLGYLGRGRWPGQSSVVLRQVRELRRRQLVVGVVVAQYCRRVAFYACNYRKSSR